MNNWGKLLLQAAGAGLVIGLVVSLVMPNSRWQNWVSQLSGAWPRTSGIVSFAPAVRKAAPAVVSLRTLSAETGDGQPRVGLGSGVIFRTDGYIVTNYHVIDDSQGIMVLLADGRRATATLVGADPVTDLAVLKIAMTGLPYLDLAKAPDVAIGDIVLSIGNPYGVGQSVSMGIVSATGRALNNNSLEEFIQTDAAINPGSSGGALINASGEVVGISSAFFSANSNGINFALPVDLVRFVTERLVRQGKVVRGWLGVSGGLLSPADVLRLGVADTGGVQIDKIYPGSPAESAGLKPGDVILRVNGQPIGDLTRFIRWLSRMEPGARLRMTILRASPDGEQKRLTINAVLAVQPETSTATEGNVRR
jgi:serine peptidase DegS